MKVRMLIDLFHGWTAGGGEVFYMRNWFMATLVYWRIPGNSGVL